MQLMHTIKHPAILMAFVLGITSCANQGLKQAQDYAEQRAEMLDKIIPINMNGYNLIRAKSISDQIELTLLYSGQDTVLTPQDLAKNLSEAYCTDQEIRELLTLGVKYKLLFRDARGRPIHQYQVTGETCSK